MNNKGSNCKCKKLSRVDEIDLLEIETGVFEVRKLFVRFLNQIRGEVLDTGPDSIAIFDRAQFDIFEPLISSYFDYLFEMAERLNRQRKSYDQDSKEVADEAFDS